MRDRVTIQILEPRLIKETRRDHRCQVCLCCPRATFKLARHALGLELGLDSLLVLETGARALDKVIHVRVAAQNRQAGRPVSARYAPTNPRMPSSPPETPAITKSFTTKGAEVDP